MSTDKRKHSALSSVSDLESSENTFSATSTPEKENNTEIKSKAQRKREAKKLKKAKLDDENLNEKDKESLKSQKMPKKKPIEEELKMINEKLSRVVTKDDNSFLKDLIKGVFAEIKDSLLASFKRQIEVIEGDLHDKSIENQNLKSEIQKMKEEMKNKSEEIERLERKNEKEKLKNQEVLNEQEQYSRRNNIRLTNLPDDNINETSADTANKVIDFIKRKLDISITLADIDIAHRLGQFKDKDKDQQRQVIVKFVRREVKNRVMQNRKKLKGSSVFINEDLTRLNNEVLACTRKKHTDEIERSWSVNGKLYIKWKADSSIENIKYSEYQKWLDLPWP